MKIKLLAFASAAEALGTNQMDYSIGDDSAEVTVSDLKRSLAQQYPQLEQLWLRLAVSVNGEVVSDAEQIDGGAEVALLPPVSGG